MTTQSLQKEPPKLSGAAYRMLGIFTVAHGVNDFYATLLPFLLPTLIDTFGLDFAGAGFLAFATSFFSNSLQPIVGHFADKWQRRKAVIVTGYLIFVCGLIIAANARSYPILLFAFLIYGLGQTTYHPQATNFITKTFAAAKGRAMGIHGIGGSLGNFTAPLLVTYLLTVLSLQLSLYLLIIPAVIVAGILAFSLDDMKRDGGHIGRFTITRELVLLSMTFGLPFMLFRGFLTFLPKYLVDSGSTLTEAGRISALMLLVGFVAQPLGGTLYDRFGGRKVFATAALLAGSALWLFLQGAWPSPLLYIILIGGAVTATFPVALATSSAAAVDDNVGMSVGVMFGISGIMSSITPALVGRIADLTSLEAAFQWLIVFAAAGFLMSFTLPEKK